MRTVPLLLLVLILSTLPSCSSFLKPKPVLQPPQVDCSERTPAEPVPAQPKLAQLPAQEQTDAWWRQYVWRLNAVRIGYEIRLLGWGQGEIEKRAEVAACLDRERAAGRIR